MDYLRAVEIRDKLASTAERGLFGGLSGPAGTWDKIVKAYEKQYVYLGECGQALVQNVDFEIPYLRKQAAKLNQQIQDCERKHAECLRNAATCAAKYKEECKKLGIEGVAVRSELRALGRELPGLMRGVVAGLHDPRLQAAADYYAAFTRFAHAPRVAKGAAAAGAAAAAGPPLEPASMLPTLFEIRARQTQPPPPEDDAAEASTSAAAGGIDWDIGGGAADASSSAAPAAAVDIDWDLGAATADAGGDGDGDGGGGGGGINWDFDMTDTGGGGGPGGDADGGAAAAAAPIAIDWDIEVDAVGDAAAANANNAAGTGAAADAADVAAAGGAASGDPDDVAAARLERDGEYRARLVDDLMELRAFLAQRKAELSSAGGEALAAAAPEGVSVTSVDGGAVAGWLGAVGGVLAQLGSPRFRQLLLIATSKRYLDRLEASLQRQAGAEAKLLRAAEDVTARRHEARGALVGTAPRVAALVERSRRLKALAERGIGAALGGKRSINVLGEINNVLAAGQ
ncbi:hypothetical protein HYH03_007889 [Edaphochlamys debaryana]|uniref:Uncharacterized protein n=1 Tax=Edaphochlamys debaryana TaxID=47281 RepID=A0A836C007_9CHLO|nr:hypothetical protein HYH03_007889 [Edaphochlamys debaryana]|eukprot:KAG2493959.1 hypothetical protein HYH03_007889 [Edaphochlamys debaryana]